MREEASATILGAVMSAIAEADGANFIRRAEITDSLMTTIVDLWPKQLTVADLENAYNISNRSPAKMVEILNQLSGLK